MKLMLKGISAVTLALATGISFAAPQYLLIHNHTNLTAGAFVGGTVPPQHPTKPNSDSKVFWGLVKMACLSHTVNGQCPALIKLGSNNEYNITVGYMNLDMNTGDISPKDISGNGYRIIINGPGEASITKD